MCVGYIQYLVLEFEITTSSLLVSCYNHLTSVRQKLISKDEDGMVKEPGRCSINDQCDWILRNFATLVTFKSIWPFWDGVFGACKFFNLLWQMLMVLGKFSSL